MEIVQLWRRIKKNTFHFPVLFFEICFTYDGLVSKLGRLGFLQPGRFFFPYGRTLKSVVRIFL